MKIELQIPINRVEGDLDIKVSITDNKITEAKSIGTLYRGFENFLKDRDPLDSLVITPRVCGICSVSHLLAAVKALEDAYKITPPLQAIRFRNLSNISENMQSDLRQVFLMFMPDFANEYYKNYSFYELANRLYQPFHGEISKKILDITKDILKIIAYIGGQWPHTSHMVPGGLSVVSDDLEILAIKYLIKRVKVALENLYGIKTEELKSINSFEDLIKFTEKNPNSQISIFFRLISESDLLTKGVSGYPFINFGALEHNKFEIPKAIYKNNIYPVDINKITEDVTHSWYEESDTNLFKAKTVPNINKKAYSFTKAPRYNNEVFQTGPLGEFLVQKHPLITNLYQKFKDSVFVREFARLIRPFKFIEAMEFEIENILKNIKAPLYKKPKIFPNAKGVGLTHAARGALGHWIHIKNGKIANYQIISPTTWNASPRDKNSTPGPWEKALVGTVIDDIDNPIQMGHIIRSFDPCLVCTVHFIGEEQSKLTI